MKFLRFSPIALSLAISCVAVAADHLSYESFLKTALERNLEIKRASAKVAAARSDADAYNIPPPMVGYMRMTDQSGSSANGFEISQSLPFPTKIGHDRSAKKYFAEAQAEMRLVTEAEIRAQSKLVYFNLWASQARLEALKEKRKVIEDHVRLSRAGVRSDSFLRIHLLKAESDYDLTENDLLAAAQTVAEREAEAAELLNADPTDYHPIADELPLTEPPSLTQLNSSHQLEVARLRLESFKQSEILARANWVPDLNLRYREIGQTQLMPKITELMIGVSLPFLFPWDNSSRTGKAAAERSESAFQFEQEKLAIGIQQAILLKRLVALKSQLNLISRKLLPRAERRMRLVHNLAPRDMETLQDHRETMEAFPDLKLKAIDLRAEYESALSSLSKYERGSP